MCVNGIVTCNSGRQILVFAALISIRGEDVVELDVDFKLLLRTDEMTDNLDYGNNNTNSCDFIKFIQIFR